MRINPFTQRSDVGLLLCSLLQLHVVEHFPPQDFGEYVDIDNY